MKSLKSYIIDKSLPTIYLDLDETLVDFTRGADQILEKFGYPKFHHSFWLKEYSETEANDIRWSIIYQQPNFWQTLRWLRDGKKLWEAVKKYKPNILSATTSMNRDICERDKLQWVKDHLGLNNVDNIHLVSRSQKQLFAKNVKGEPNLLIDDYDKNCNEWRTAGGLAIQRTSASEVINKLRKLGF
jgi:5'(3')-deoxyribonucleotidase